MRVKYVVLGLKPNTKDGYMSYIKVHACTICSYRCGDVEDISISLDRLRIYAKGVATIDLTTHENYINTKTQ